MSVLPSTQRGKPWSQQVFTLFYTKPTRSRSGPETSLFESTLQFSHHTGPKNCKSGSGENGSSQGCLPHDSSSRNAASFRNEAFSRQPIIFLETRAKIKNVTTTLPDRKMPQPGSETVPLHGISGQTRLWASNSQVQNKSTYHDALKYGRVVRPERAGARTAHGLCKASWQVDLRLYKFGAQSKASLLSAVAYTKMWS